ncbi:sex-lethal homolog [Teleopsis dalmanni]|uniref:sex-lethal homolog n=1 Tax=Teleopsis dalmanni TaxID=139649 RepID=UPI0018CEA73A|nr:sex-lethal homolog [Teleopsis dalmanni]
MNNGHALRGFCCRPHPSKKSMQKMSHSFLNVTDGDFKSSYPDKYSRHLYFDFTIGDGPDDESGGDNGGADDNGNSGGNGGRGGSGSIMGSLADMATITNTNLLNYDAIKTNLTVKNLPLNATENQLYNIFRTCGPVNSCNIFRDINSGYNFGYANVDFFKAEDSYHAVKNLNGIMMNNKRLEVSYAHPNHEKLKDTILYISNLPSTFTDYKLKALFSQYGSVIQYHIARDKQTGESRGYAFVRFNMRHEAYKAISGLNRATVVQRTKPISVQLNSHSIKLYYYQWIRSETPNINHHCDDTLMMNNYCMGRVGSNQNRFKAIHRHYNFPKFI